MAAQALLELLDERTPVGVRPRFVDPSEIWEKPVRRREERPQHRDRGLVARGSQRRRQGVGREAGAVMAVGTEAAPRGSLAPPDRTWQRCPPP